MSGDWPGRTARWSGFCNGRSRQSSLTDRSTLSHTFAHAALRVAGSKCDRTASPWCLHAFQRPLLNLSCTFHLIVVCYALANCDRLHKWPSHFVLTVPKTSPFFVTPKISLYINSSCSNSCVYFIIYFISPYRQHHITVKRHTKTIARVKIVYHKKTNIETTTTILATVVVIQLLKLLISLVWYSDVSSKSLFYANVNECSLWIVSAAHRA